jgi:hypothetical protein
MRLSTLLTAIDTEIQRAEALAPNLGASRRYPSH